MKTEYTKAEYVKTGNKNYSYQYSHVGIHHSSDWSRCCLTAKSEGIRYLIKIYIYKLFYVLFIICYIG